jgi:hypothetical protein
MLHDQRKKIQKISFLLKEKEQEPDKKLEAKDINRKPQQTRRNRIK